MHVCRVLKNYLGTAIVTDLLVLCASVRINARTADLELGPE